MRLTPEERAPVTSRQEWIETVKNEEVFSDSLGETEYRTYNKKEATWFGHILHRN